MIRIRNKAPNSIGMIKYKLIKKFALVTMSVLTLLQLFIFATPSYASTLQQADTPLKITCNPFPVNNDSTSTATTTTGFEGLPPCTTPGSEAKTTKKNVETVTNCAQTVNSKSASLKADTACLPAFRWTNTPIETGSDSSVRGIFRNMLTFITTLFLTIAQFIWNVILWIASIGDLNNKNNPIAKTMGNIVNDAIAYVGGMMVGFTALFWALALYRVGKDFLRGKIGQAVKALFIFAIIYAFIFVTTGASMAAKDDGDKNAGNHPLTLPWMAGRVTDLATRVVNPIVESVSESANKQYSSSSVDSTVTCANYVKGLNTAYSNGTENNARLLAMSSMWYDTQYNFWKAAQFGNPVGDGVDIPDNAMCHWAESNNGVAAFEQQAFARSIYGVSAITDPNTKILPVFQKDGVDYDMKLREATAWAICTFDSTDSKWVTRSEWKGVGSDTGDLSQDNYGDACNKVFTGKINDMILNKGQGWGGVDLGVVKIGGFRFNRDDPFAIYNSDTYAGAFKSSTDATYIEKTKSARAFAEAIVGNNLSDKIPNGFFSIVIAILILFVFTPLLLGVLIANLMLYVLLIFLPVILALYASGVKKASGMLKLTGTTMVSSVFFTLLVTAIIFISEVLRAALGALPFGFFRPVLVGLSPVLAFLIVNKILKAFGMASILSPTGALSFIASSSMIATGDAKLSKMGKVDPKTGKNSIQKGMTSAGASAISAGFGAAKKLSQLKEVSDNKKKFSKLEKKAKSQKELKDSLEGDKKGLKEAEKSGAFKELNEFEEIKKNQELDKKAKRQAAQELIAKDFNDRGKLGYTGRVNKMFDFLDKKAVGLGDGTEDRGKAGNLFDNMLLHAATHKNKAMNMLDPETRNALGYGVKDNSKPFASSWSNQIFDKNVTGEPTDFKSPNNVPSNLVQMKNNIAKDRFTKETMNMTPSEIENYTDNNVGKFIDNVTSQYNPDGAPTIQGPVAMALAYKGASEMLGVPENQVMVSSNGIPMIKVSGMSARDRKNLPADAFRNPYMYFTDEFLEIRENEDTDQYTTRMHIAMREAGYMDDQGNMVDMLDKHNLTIDDVEAYQNGAKNAKLGKIKISVKGNDFIRKNRAASRVIKVRQEENMSQREDYIFSSAAELKGSVESIPVQEKRVIEHTELILEVVEEYATFITEYDERKQSNNLTKELESKRAEFRKRLDSAKNKWVSESVSFQSNIIASDVLSDVITDSNKQANDVLNQLLDQMSTFTSEYEKLDEELDRMYKGDISKLKSVKEAIEKNATKQRNDASQVRTSINKALAEFNNATSQSEAVNRRTTLNYQKTTKELYEDMIQGSFPREYNG